MPVPPLSGLELLAILTLASPAMADSDGYFCTTSSYLAYEVGLPGYGPHELHIVSLTPPLTERSKHAFRLPDFQVHGLLCKEAEVLLLGWDYLYTVSGLRPVNRPPYDPRSSPTAGTDRPSFRGLEQRRISVPLHKNSLYRSRRSTPTSS